MIGKRFLTSLLCNCDFVTQAQSNTLSLAANANVTNDRTVDTSLNAQVGQRVLSKDASCVHVGREESAVAL